MNGYVLINTQTLELYLPLKGAIKLEQLDRENSGIFTTRKAAILYRNSIKAWMLGVIKVRWYNIKNRYILDV
jgi:hypothetical protein